MSAAGTGLTEGEGRRGAEGESCASLCITAICSVQPKLLLDIMRHSQSAWACHKAEAWHKKKKQFDLGKYFASSQITYIKEAIKVVNEGRLLRNESKLNKYAYI